MLRTIEVEVDKHTWPNAGGGSPAFPASFTHGVTRYDLNVLSTLLIIGQLTTPSIASGATLSEFWAWVRYANAIASTPDLRVTKPFADLDSHQKTILSDDFGMGVPIAWLADSLGIVAWCDGRYFQERMSALLHRSPPSAPKRGPKKSPDFVLQDSSGSLHIVECKGTQSSPRTREKQFNSVDAHGSATGGCVQKRAFAIHPILAGQRLVCGLVLGREDGRVESSIKIVDPEFDEETVPPEADPLLWKDPMIRSTLAKVLRSAGLQTTASAIAAPSGLLATSRSRPSARSVETRRERLVGARRDAARAEIRAALDRPRISIGDLHLVGRELKFTFPIETKTGSTELNSIAVQQGVSAQLLSQLAETGLEDGPINVVAPWLTDQISGIKMYDEDNRGTLKIGSIHTAQVTLNAEKHQLGEEPNTTYA